MRAHVKWILMAFVMAPPCFVEAYIPYSCTPNSEAPVIIATYTLKDLGPTALKAEQLTKLEPLYSLAPAINNRTQVAYNKQDGSYIRDPNVGEYALSFPGVKVYSHALNNNGEVLVSLERPQQQIEWMLWDQKSTLNSLPDGKRYHIDHLDRKSKDFYCSLNDCGVVTGFKEIQNQLHPFIWERRSGLNPLGYYRCYDIAGFPRGINQHGTVVGFYEDRTDSPPFVWSCHSGLNVLRNYRNLVNCLGWIELADLVIGADNTVYGTYIVKYVSSRANPKILNHYFMYSWQTDSGDFKLIDVEDMRLAAINTAGTMVGSRHGHAAIYDRNSPPMDLNTMLSTNDQDWELLEATGINDLGQIVGYGTYKGEMHIFLLELTL